MVCSNLFRPGRKNSPRHDELGSTAAGAPAMHRPPRAERRFKEGTDQADLRGPGNPSCHMLSFLPTGTFSSLETWASIMASRSTKSSGAATPRQKQVVPSAAQHLELMRPVGWSGQWLGILPTPTHPHHYDSAKPRAQADLGLACH